MKRGEIWTVAGGPDYSGKPRPAVVVQDERFDATESVTVCVLTTSLTSTPLLGGTTVRPQIEPSEQNGLKSRSHIMTDKVTTVPARKFGERIGVLAEQDAAMLDDALLVFLGLVRRTG